MAKPVYYLATFTALIAADSEAEAQKRAEGAAADIEDYIGVGASGDPRVYRTKATGVALYTGPDPFPEDGEDEEYDVGRVRGVAHEAARLARLEPQRPIEQIVAELVDGEVKPMRCEHDIPFDAEPECRECAVKIRNYLSGLSKRATS